nr:hypothetical protein [Methylobacterium currus]
MAWLRENVPALSTPAAGPATSGAPDRAFRVLRQEAGVHLPRDDVRQGHRAAARQGQQRVAVLVLTQHVALPVQGNTVAFRGVEAVNDGVARIRPETVLVRPGPADQDVVTDAPVQRVGALLAKQNVDAVSARQDVVAGSAAELVGPVVTQQHVGLAAAVQPVAAGPTEQRVGPLVTDQHVVAEFVVAEIADQGVGTVAVTEAVVAVLAEQGVVVRVADQHVGARSAAQLVVAGAADQDIGVGAAIHAVVAVLASQAVVTSATDQGVITGPAEQAVVRRFAEQSIVNVIARYHYRRVVVGSLEKNSLLAERRYTGRDFSDSTAI